MPVSRDLVLLGRVSRPHGVKGEIKVFPFTESPESFKHYSRVIIRPAGRPAGQARVLAARPQNRYVLLKLEGVSTREEAQALSGAEILVERTWLPDPEPDEYYWVDLIGLEVYDEQNQPLGQVENLLETGADDLLVLNYQGREILLPFNEEIILEVDLDRGRLIASPPKDLLEI